MELGCGNVQLFLNPLIKFKNFSHNIAKKKDRPTQKRKNKMMTQNTKFAQNREI